MTNAHTHSTDKRQFLLKETPDRNSQPHWDRPLWILFYKKFGKEIFFIWLAEWIALFQLVAVVITLTVLPLNALLWRRRKCSCVHLLCCVPVPCILTLDYHKHQINDNINSLHGLHLLVEIISSSQQNCNVDAVAFIFFTSDTLLTGNVAGICMWSSFQMASLTWWNERCDNYWMLLSFRELISWADGVAPNK